MVLEGNPQRIKNACNWFCVNGPMRLVEIFMVNFDGTRLCVLVFSRFFPIYQRDMDCSEKLPYNVAHYFLLKKWLNKLVPKIPYHA